MDVEYRYDTTGHNNGQIGSMKDWVSGTTNRITSSGFSYNANGTMATMPNWQGTYDKESRLVDVTQSQNGTESYEYDGAGRRIWTSNGMTETIQFYGVDGKRLAKCQIQEVSYPAYGYTFACTGITYLLGQVVMGKGESGRWGPWGAARDRLGSVRVAPDGYYNHGQGVNASSYFPYGQARTGGSVWATYQPSSVSGTMYAMNREYSAAYGRFLTPDPSAGVSLGNPGSWNRYAYVQGDPVNYTDQQGLRLEPANDLAYEDPAGRSMFDVPYVLGGPGGGGYRTYGPLMAGTIYTTIPGAAWDGVAGEGGTPLPGAPFNFDRGPAGSGTDVYRRECDRNIGTNAQKLDWINAHVADAGKIAKQLGVSTEDILGLSALESGWGTGRFAKQGNNYFSLHYPALLATGYLLTADGKVKVATFQRYAASAESFASSYASIISGISDPASFAAALQNAGKYGINRDGSKVAAFVGDVTATIDGLALRLTCPR